MNFRTDLAAGRCPHSGLILHRDGEAGPHAASCDMCDCFGFDPQHPAVKVHPRPLRVARWKVTRRKCLQCGRSFAADKYSNTCYSCLKKTMDSLDSLW